MGHRLSILLLSDVPDGWIVSRLADRMVEEMYEIDWRRGHYCSMSTEEIVERAADCDLIHAMNWNFASHLPGVLRCNKPVLVSVRSHRYSPSVKQKLKGVEIHAISRALQAEFPGSQYIPDGLLIDPQPLRVGFAGKPGPYKGTDLIERACRRIGARLSIASDACPGQMPGWYRSIDVYCCASEQEGFGAPVMEALAMNKPVVSTRVGAAYCDAASADLGITWVDRSVEGIAEGLLQHYPARWLARYTWPVIAEQFRALYGRVVESHVESYA